MSVKHSVEQLYSDLKYKHGILQDALAMTKIENTNLKEGNKKLLNQLKQVREQLEARHDEVVHRLPKSSVDGHYVSLKKYQKQVKLTEYFIDLYHSVTKPKKIQA